MLVTILKGKKVIEVTFQIIETFAKIRNLLRNIFLVSSVKEKEIRKKLMQKSGILFNNLFDENLNSDDSQTTFEINFTVLQFKNIIRKKRD